MYGVRIRVGRGEGVDDPGQSSVGAHNDIGIVVEGEKRRQRSRPVMHVAQHQQAAVGRHIVAEWELRDVSTIECQQRAAQESAQHDAAVAFVRSEIVRLAFRIIELLLMSLYVDVCIRYLAKIDLGPRHRKIGNGALHRHIAQKQRGQPLCRKAVHRIHGDSVAVGVNELVVDPVAAAFGKFVNVQFAGGEHYFAQASANLVAIDVDIGKIVVGANLLFLAQRILERLPVPEPYVLERRLVVGRIRSARRGFGRELALRKAVQPVRLAGHCNVVGNVRPLAVELVRLHQKGADVPANRTEHHKTHGRGNNRQGQPPPARTQHPDGDGNDPSDHQRHGDKQHPQQRDVRVRVRNAIEDGVMLEEQLEAAYIFTHCKGEQQKAHRDGDAAPGQ